MKVLLSGDNFELVQQYYIIASINIDFLRKSFRPSMVINRIDPESETC